MRVKRDEPLIHGVICVVGLYWIAIGLLMVLRQDLVSDQTLFGLPIPHGAIMLGSLYIVGGLVIVGFMLSRFGKPVRQIPGNYASWWLFIPCIVLPLAALISSFTVIAYLISLISFFIGAGSYSKRLRAEGSISMK